MFKKIERPSDAMAFIGTPLLWGTVVGTLCVSLLLFLAAGICVAVDVPDTLLTTMALGACGLGAFFGGLIAGKLTKRKGWLVGLLCGVCLTVLVTGIGALCVGVLFSSHFFISLLIGILCATCGGMIGVNLKRNDFSV